jgi:HKD family nuclease
MRALLFCFLFAFSVAAQAISLKDYNHYNYEVLFTNPQCATYGYKQPIESRGGEILTTKPRNVYCTKSDASRSGRRKVSPHYRLKEWIKDAETKEIFFTFLSFSNQDLRYALCDAVKERGVKITFILDNRDDESAYAQARRLQNCLPPSGDIKAAPQLHIRGKMGGIGFAHNKLFVVNPRSNDKVKLAYTSANLSSGTVLHHENWHFVTTTVNSYFYKAHQCMMKGMLEYGKKRTTYRDFISRCRKQIKLPEEDDIKTFFVPGEGSKALSTLKKALAKSEDTFLAAHRFSHGEIHDAVLKGLKSGMNLRVVVDDDMYWAGIGDIPDGIRLDNNRGEYSRVVSMYKAGGRVRYMETNHFVHLLHHNKFMVFSNTHKGVPGVYTGAGNFTKSAYERNYENYYFITIPEVVEAFQKQTEHMWENLATSYDDLPKRNIKPVKF